MRTAKDETRIEIHKRYWRSWATEPGWGLWYQHSPKIHYPYDENNLEALLKKINTRIKKAKAADLAMESYLAMESHKEYRVMKVREILLEEEIIQTSNE
jgi:hypothetical protein